MGVGEGADVEVDADTDVIAELGEAREVSVVVVLAVTESLIPRSSLSSSTLIGWCDCRFRVGMSGTSIVDAATATGLAGRDSRSISSR